MSIHATKLDTLSHGVSLKARVQLAPCNRLPAAVGRDRLDCSGLTVRFRNGVPVGVQRNARRGHLIAKRGLDVMLSAGAIVALTPIFSVVALLIKLEDGGPVMFRQQRIGKDGKLFEVFKFRSMRVEACDHSGAKQTQDNDSRITRVGRWIRQTSIDELPQIFNIFKGDMSVVGPRPHVPSQKSGGRAIGEVVPYYDHRHKMLPGLTGWAQANGYRGPTDDTALAIARTNHDLAYIENFSIWLDIKSILHTLRPVSMLGKAF